MKLEYVLKEDAIIAALLANKYTEGWGTGDWIPPGWNADYGGLDVIEALEHLLNSKNII